MDKKIFYLIFREFDLNVQRLNKIERKLCSMEEKVKKDEKYEPSMLIAENNKQYNANIDERNELIEEAQKLKLLIYLREFLFSKLTQKEREIVYCRFDLGYNVEKCAETLFISQATIYRICNKMYERLSDYIEMYDDLI